MVNLKINLRADHIGFVWWVLWCFYWFWAVSSWSLGQNHFASVFFYCFLLLQSQVGEYWIQRKHHEIHSCAKNWSRWHDDDDDDHACLCSQWSSCSSSAQSLSRCWGTSSLTASSSQNLQRDHLYLYLYLYVYLYVCICLCMLYYSLILNSHRISLNTWTPSSLSSSVWTSSSSPLLARVAKSRKKAARKEKLKGGEK